MKSGECLTNWPEWRFCRCSATCKCRLRGVWIVGRRGQAKWWVEAIRARSAAEVPPIAGDRSDDLQHLRELVFRDAGEIEDVDLLLLRRLPPDAPGFSQKMAAVTDCGPSPVALRNRHSATFAVGAMGSGAEPPPQTILKISARTFLLASVHTPISGRILLTNAIGPVVLLAATPDARQRFSG